MSPAKDSKRQKDKVSNKLVNRVEHSAVKYITARFFPQEQNRAEREVE